MNVAIWHPHYVIFKEPNGAPNPDAPERFIIPPNGARIKAKHRGDFRRRQDAA
jgi:hypothetical protein